VDKSLKSRVSKSRRLLKNQYAHIEYLEDFKAELQTAPGPTSIDSRIAASRKLLQNPYAYLDGSGAYSAIVDGVAEESVPRRSADPTSDAIPSAAPGNGTAPRRNTGREIEVLVKDLHTRLWKDRASLWNGAVPTDPIDILDPAVALRLVGYECELEEGFVPHHGDGGLVEVAGYIDRTSKTVRISRQFPLNVQTFTAAHELGHAVLHHAMGAVHRDRPMDGLKRSRDQVELEADKFATYFLMPEKLVRSRFSGLFGAEEFKLNEETAFALSCTSLQEFRMKYRTRRDLARLLASTECYDRRHFVSLATQFRVSIGAMAIRIEELGLLPV